MDACNKLPTSFACCTAVIFMAKTQQIYSLMKEIIITKWLATLCMVIVHRCMYFDL